MTEPNSRSVPVQQKLYELGKPLLQLVRLVGYFPFSVSKNFVLTANHLSVPFFWSTFLCAIALFKMLNYVVIKGFSKFILMSKLDKVEAFCQLLLATTAITSVFTFTLKGILTLKKAVYFWNRNCSVLQEFTCLHPSFDFCIQSNQYQKLFQIIGRKVKTPAVFVCFFGIVAPTAMFMLHVSPTGVKLTPATAAFHAAPGRSWASMAMKIVLQTSSSISYLYMGLAAYMAFFLMVYSACLQIIATELKKLSRERGDEDLKLPEKSLDSLYSPYLEACIQETHEVAIRNCLRGYEIIEELVSEFNTQFSFEIILEAIKSVISVLVYAFFILTRGISPLAAFVTVGPAIAMGFRLYALATEATEVRKGADAVACELQRLEMDTLTVGTRAKIQMVSMKILNSPPLISPGHYFTMDRRLIVSILSFMATYLVILVQFKDIK